MNLIFALATLCTIQSGARLGVHSDEVLCLALSPDGKTLASGSSDGYVKTWDLETRTSGKNRYFTRGATRSLAFTPDGKNVAIGRGEGRVLMVDFEEFDEWKVLDGPEGAVTSLAISPDGEKVFLIVDEDKKLYVWKPRTRDKVENFEHESPLIAFALSRDGKKMTTAVGSGKVRVFSTDPVERLHQLSFEGAPTCIAFSADANRLACGGGSGVRLWDTATGKSITTFKPAPCAASCLAFTPNGSSLVIGTEGGAIVVVDARTGAHAAKLEGHEKAVTGVAVSGDGKTLFSGSRDKTVRLWALK